MNAFSERVPPNDLDAERYVLGACLIEADILPQIRQTVKATDFYSLIHQDVFTAICAVNDRRERPDIGTVQAELKNQERLDDVGGIKALMSYCNDVPTTANSGAYANIVAQKASIRRLQTAARQIVDECYTTTEAETIRADALAKIQAAVFSGTNSIVKPVGLDLYEYLETNANDRAAGKPNRNIVPTSFRDQDIRMPMERGTVTVVPSPSGIGKTTWMFQLLLGTARLGEPAIGFSLEMSKTQILQKVWANVARLNTMKVRHLALTDDEWERSLSTASELLDVPFHYALKRRMRFTDVRLESLAFKSRHGKLGIVAVDYWQIIGDRPLRDERKDEMLGRLVEEAKDLAIEADCHVVILAQAKIDSTRPIPANEDVKESRAIVASADNILFLTRPLEFGDAKIKLPAQDGRSLIECRCNDADTIDPTRKMFENIMLGIPGKARMGPKDIIPYYIELETGRMGDLTRPWPWDNPRGIPRNQLVQ